MVTIAMPDGSIKQVTNIVAKILKIRGGRELSLTPIDTPTIIHNQYEDDTRTTRGADKVPRTRGSRKPRQGKGSVPNAVRKSGGAK